MINTSNLKKRLVFVAFAVPIAIVFVGSQFDIAEVLRNLFVINEEVKIFPGQLLAFTIVMFGTYEYMRMLSIANKRNGFWLAYIYIIVMSGSYLLGKNIPTVVSNCALILIVAFETFYWGREASQGRWKRASLFLGGMILLSIASVGIMSLFREPFRALFAESNSILWGNISIVAVITAIYFCDSAAYFVGSAWGKRKLASSISPKKTLEGSIGGLVVSMTFMSVCWIFMRAPNQPIYIGVIMGVIIGVMAQVGDLLMSLIKRYFHVKDSSDMIPGHGGVLDRFDSVFFTAPVLNLFAWLMMRAAALV